MDSCEHTVDGKPGIQIENFKNTDLTYSWPHDSSSSLDPNILNFRHSRPSLIVMPRTEIMSAKNL